MSLVCRRCQQPIAEPELQEYDSKDLEDVKEYNYKKLPSGKKRIRLLKLYDASTNSADIYCEFDEAEYDQFHLPRTTTTDEETEEVPDLPEYYKDELDTCLDAQKRQEMEDKREKHKQEKMTELEKKQTEQQQKSNEQREKEEEKAKMKEENDFEKALDNRVQYDALSWCWGTDDPKYALKVRDGGRTYKLKIKRELALALKYLRYRDRVRMIWVDAVCIDQTNPHERNHQVQMMSRIYTRAEMVCIWLGEHTEDSKIAIDFIRDEVMELKNIEMLCTDKRYTRKWQALQMLMQTEWFSRRWVVQEIALAKQAKIYCGADEIAWKDFAIAVELFVEVETATHRLSEIMQNDEKFRHIPNWFEYVSELGASLLVQATGKVFRGQATPLHDSEVEGYKEEYKKDQLTKWRKTRTTDLLERRSLLSLEYLVSTMFIFKATEPRDVVYSLLAIARDAAPYAGFAFDEGDTSYLTMSLFEQFLEEKPFLIDYSRPYSDVCRDFVLFVIKRKSKIDAVQALDILCRPWSLEPPQPKPRVRHERHDRDKKKRDTWFIRVSAIKRDEQNGMQWKLDKKELDVRKVDQRTMKEYKDEYEKAYKNKIELPLGESDKWRPAEGWNEWKDWCNKYKNGEIYRDVEELPSWVARASRAPFSLDYHPGMRVRKVGRANADPLVGQPTDGHRNYSAAQTRHVNLEVLKFRKRPELRHYSMYVQGFILDTVDQVQDASQGGEIPGSWLHMGGWEPPYKKDPPDDLWRTLVADRGRDDRNPPYYYARACRESVQKGNITSGRVNTTSLINNERNSIITEFCRRVHAVIWNRRMFKTKANRLGLAYDVKKGDKVCVLYGCTVPVILKQTAKKATDVAEEELADRREALKACIWQCEANRESKPKRESRRDKNKRKWLESGEWYQMLEDKKEAERKMKEREEEKEEEEKRDDQAEEQKNDANTSQKENSEQAEQDGRNFFYTFRGDCYLHGMMDGEAVREKFYNELQDRVFELR